MPLRLVIVIVSALVAALLAACAPRQYSLEGIPTVAPSIEDMATGIVLTQNAPPPPYNEGIAFPQIDSSLSVLPGWRYEVRLEFNGVFARTTRATQATATAEVTYNQLASARRVVLTTSGELIGQSEDSAYEAVRLGPDAFLLRDTLCQNRTPAAGLAADLSAGTLIGGVAHAVPAGRQGTLHGEQVYGYTFTSDALLLPAIRTGDGGAIGIASSELWFSAEHNAVVRFWVNLDVQNAFIFDRQLPVDGTVLIRYDLYDIGTPFNITIPFGC